MKIRGILQVLLPVKRQGEVETGLLHLWHLVVGWGGVQLGGKGLEK